MTGDEARADDGVAQEEPGARGGRPGPEKNLGRISAPGFQRHANRRGRLSVEIAKRR